MTEGVIELRAGAARLRLAPHLGGRITACELAGPGGIARPVLHPYPEDHADLDAWAKGGLYPLVPYSGRVRDAALWHEGREVPLQPHAGSPHTLHGIAQRRAWAVVDAGADHAAIVYRHAPDAHWPWAFEARMDIALAPARATVRVALRNTGEGRMPGGIGLHPYLLHDAAEAVAYRACEPWPFDADYLALPMPQPADTVQAQVLGADRFQAGEVTLFHGLWQGPLQLLDARTGRGRLQLTGSGALSQLVVHRPAAAPYLCVEPVSHVADGFNLAARGQAGTGTRVLAPGEALAGALVMDAAGDARGRDPREDVTPA